MQEDATDLPCTRSMLTKESHPFIHLSQHWFEKSEGKAVLPIRAIFLSKLLCRIYPCWGDRRSTHHLFFSLLEIFPLYLIFLWCLIAVNAKWDQQVQTLLFQLYLILLQFAEIPKGFPEPFRWCRFAKHVIPPSECLTQLELFYVFTLRKHLAGCNSFSHLKSWEHDCMRTSFRCSMIKKRSGEQDMSSWCFHTKCLFIFLWGRQGRFQENHCFPSRKVTNQPIKFNIFKCLVFYRNTGVCYM